jgi:hypothetical protein
MPSEELTPETIAEAATQPASASVDGRSAAAVSIGDQIKAHQYAAAQTALEGTNESGGPVSGWGKLRTAKVKPPSAV